MNEYKMNEHYFDFLNHECSRTVRTKYDKANNFEYEFE